MILVSATKTKHSSPAMNIIEDHHRRCGRSGIRDRRLSAPNRTATNFYQPITLTDQQQHSNTQPEKIQLFQFFSDNFSTVFLERPKQNCSFRKKKNQLKKKFSTFFASRKQKKNEGKIFFSTIFRRRLFLILIKQKFVI
jgi:hypothetical protein